MVVSSLMSIYRMNAKVLAKIRVRGGCSLAKIGLQRAEKHLFLHKKTSKKTSRFIAY